MSYASSRPHLLHTGFINACTTAPSYEIPTRLYSVAHTNLCGLVSRPDASSPSLQLSRELFACWLMAVSWCFNQLTGDLGPGVWNPRWAHIPPKCGRSAKILSEQYAYAHTHPVLIFRPPRFTDVLSPASQPLPYRRILHPTSDRYGVS